VAEPDVGEGTRLAAATGAWICFELRREALLIRVEVRDLRLWPVAAGRCS
jgi:hypothetical protein